MDSDDITNAGSSIKEVPMITVEDVMKAANFKYGVRKRGLCLINLPPEERPQIRSDQVKALAEALVDEINRELIALAQDIARHGDYK